MKEISHLSHTQREKELEMFADELREEKYIVDAKCRALSAANICLIKRINGKDRNRGEYVFNSKEYRKIKNKY